MSEETAPIGGEHSSALQVLSANLKSSRTDTIIDIRSVLLEITFYESLARPYITGYLTLIDSERIFENFDVQGGEEIEIIIKRSTEIQSAKQIVQNYVIHSIENTYDTQEFTDVVVVRLIDKETFRSGLKNVNRSFEGTPDKIIHNIMVDYMDRDDLLTSADQSKTESMKVIVPNMTPIEATQWIRNRAVNLNGFPFYLYKSAITNEYFFQDLEQMISKPCVNENAPFVNTQSAGSSTIKSRDVVIKKYEQSQTDDLYSLIRDGVVGSEQRYYDVTTGDFEIVDFNINNDLLVDIAELNPRQKKPLIDGYLACDDKSVSNYKSVIGSKISGGKVFSYEKSYDEAITEGDNRKKIKAYAAQKLMEKFQIKIAVDGSDFFHGNHYGVGNNVKVLIRSKSSDENNITIDRKQSGDYLIIAAQYVVDPIDGNCNVVLELAKFSNYQSDTYNT